MLLRVLRFHFFLSPSLASLSPLPCRINLEGLPEVKIEFRRRAAVSPPTTLRRDPIRGDRDLAVRRRWEPYTGDTLVPRGLGATGRHHAEHKRRGESRDGWTVLLQVLRVRLSGTHRLRQHLHPRAAEHRVEEGPVRARRGSRQGTLQLLFHLF